MSRYGDYTKKEYINEKLEEICLQIYGKDFYYLTPEEKNELIGVILSILSDNLVETYNNDFKDPILKDE